jgi:hypothetical protein
VYDEHDKTISIVLYLSFISHQTTTFVLVFFVTVEKLHNVSYDRYIIPDRLIAFNEQVLKSTKR